MRNNRADGRKSDWHGKVAGKDCDRCGTSGSEVDDRGRHVGACRKCRGFGKVER